MRRDGAILRRQFRASTYSRSFGSGNAVSSWVTLIRRWCGGKINSKGPSQPFLPSGPTLGVRDKCCPLQGLSCFMSHGVDDTWRKQGTWRSVGGAWPAWRFSDWDPGFLQVTPALRRTKATVFMPSKPKR